MQERRESGFLVLGLPDLSELQVHFQDRSKAQAYVAVIAAGQRRSLPGERPELNGALFFLPKPKQPQPRGQPRPSAIFGPDKATPWERNGMLVYESPLSRDAPAEEVAEIFAPKEWLPENRRKEAIKTLYLSSLDITSPVVANSQTLLSNT